MWFREVKRRQEDLIYDSSGYFSSGFRILHEISVDSNGSVAEDLVATCVVRIATTLRKLLFLRTDVTD